MDGLSARCFGSAEEFLESGMQGKAACLITDSRSPPVFDTSTINVSGHNFSLRSAESAPSH